MLNKVAGCSGEVAGFLRQGGRFFPCRWMVAADFYKGGVLLLGLIKVDDFDTNAHSL